MNALYTLLVMNIKLLLRNKGFLFFLLIVPIFSVVLLNVRMTNIATSKEKQQQIIELKSMKEKAAYERDYNLMPVLVYDKSMTELSELFLNQLTESGLYQIYRLNATNMSDTEMESNMKYHLDKDAVVCFLSVDKDFDEKIMSGKIDEGLSFYQTGLDKREELFGKTLEQVSVIFLKANEGKGKEELLKQLKAYQRSLPKKQVTLLDTSNSKAITRDQEIALYSVKISISIVTIAFLYAGIFIAQTAVEEKNNLVYTRLQLTGTGELTYILAKIIVTLMTGFFQTVIMGIGIAVFVKTDLGISIWNYLFLISLLGLIFCNLSLVTGILLNNVMSASYLAFMVWSVSSMLAGLYFPLEDAGKVLKSISNLMPQKWTVVAAEGIMAGNSSVYIMILSITMAYLLIILSTGAVGLRRSRNE